MTFTGCFSCKMPFILMHEYISLSTHHVSCLPAALRKERGWHTTKLPNRIQTRMLWFTAWVLSSYDRASRSPGYAYPDHLDSLSYLFIYFNFWAVEKFCDVSAFLKNFSCLNSGSFFHMQIPNAHKNRPVEMNSERTGTLLKVNSVCMLPACIPSWIGVNLHACMHFSNL